MIAAVRWSSKNRNHFHRIKPKKWLMSLKTNNPKANKNKFRMAIFSSRKTILRGITTYKLKINFISMKLDLLFLFDIAQFQKLVER